MIIWELEGERTFRFLAAFSIVDAALSMLIPLLHRISKTDQDAARPLTTLEERNMESIDQEINRLQQEIKKLEMLRAEITGPEHDP